VNYSKKIKGGGAFFGGRIVYKCVLANDDTSTVKLYRRHTTKICRVHTYDNSIVTPDITYGGSDQNYDLVHLEKLNRSFLSHRLPTQDISPKSVHHFFVLSRFLLANTRTRTHSNENETQPRWRT